MITPEYVRTMAAYNAWQNGSLYGAAGTLSDEDRRVERGAFFGSIHATLNHLLWGDQIWMSRFAGTPPPRAGTIPESPRQIEDWDALVRERTSFDGVMTEWAGGLSADWLAGDLTWHSQAAGRELSAPRALLVAHMFNHGTHHRGQVHAMLTQAGAKPGDTDLMLLPSRL
jgi:uncharacterized damage-inducible protein DinB